MRGGLSISLAPLCIVTLLFLGCRKPVPHVKRLPNNPIITFETSPTLGDNINGPSVIRVPEWINNPLGKYYMYFAHHKGDYVRLAYADNIEGPWTIYEEGTLRLNQVPIFRDHIASPDVHVDHEAQRIRMYVHGPSRRNGQRTIVATSRNGRKFKAENKDIGRPYFRVFQYQDMNYAVDRGGFINRSPFPDHGWERTSNKLIKEAIIEDRFGSRNAQIRHCAVYLKSGLLYVFYSRVADAPERILMSSVPLIGDCTMWTASNPVEILRPEMTYEGLQYENAPSEGGPGIEVQQLRDPYVFDDGGQLYLFYSVAGEMGIAVARLKL